MSGNKDKRFPLLIYSTDMRIFRFEFTTEELQLRASNDSALSELLLARASKDAVPHVGTYKVVEDNMIITWTNPNAKNGFEHLPSEDSPVDFPYAADVLKAKSPNSKHAVTPESKRLCKIATPKKTTSVSTPNMCSRDLTFDEVTKELEVISTMEGTSTNFVQSNLSGLKQPLIEGAKGLSPLKKCGQMAPDTDSECAGVMCDMSDNATWIFVFNLPRLCSPKDVEDVIILNMHLLGLAAEKGSPVSSCKIVDGNIAHVKIRSHNEALACLALDGLDFKGCALHFSLTPPESSACKEVLLPMSKIVLQANPGTSMDLKSTSSSDNPKNQGLESDAAYVAVLKQLIVRRENVMVSRMKKGVMEEILNALHLQNFNFDASGVLAKKRYAVKYYYSRKKVNDQSWRFYDLVAQLVGDQEFTGAFAAVKTGCDRVKWSAESTKMLVYEFGTRKELFDKVHNKHQLWEEIAAEIHTVFPQMMVTWESCEAKWKLLRQTYLDLKQEAGQSGNDGVVLSWPFYEPMNKVLGTSVCVEPVFTFACGVEKIQKERSVSAEEANKQPAKNKPKSHKGKGSERPRLSNVVRKLELEEKKVKLQQQFITLMTNQMLKSTEPLPLLGVSSGESSDEA